MDGPNHPNDPMIMSAAKKASSPAPKRTAAKTKPKPKAVKAKPASAGE